MFTITASVSTVQCGVKKTKKSFKKFGKRLAKQRRADLDLMGQRVKDIAHDEERRARQLAKDHREFIESLVGRQEPVAEDDDVSFFDLE